MKFSTLLLLFISLSFFSTAQSGLGHTKPAERKRNRIATVPKLQVREYKLYGYTDSTKLIFTASSTCKMICLAIDETRVREILKNGIVNLELSNLRSDPKQYTLEYFVAKTLHRVVVAPHNTSLNVFSLEKYKSNTRCDCD